MHLPEPLELREQLGGAAHGNGIAHDALHPPVLPLDHQSGTFQHGHMFLHGGKRRLVLIRELRDGRLGRHYAGQDIASGGIRERAEEGVDVSG